MAELTDEQLLKMARDQYKRVRDAHVLGDIPDDGTGRTVYDFDLLAYGRAAIAAAKAAATPEVGWELLTDGALRSILIEAGLKEARDFTGPEWCAMSREERKTYEEWGCFEDRVMVAMRRAADRAARPQPTAEALQRAYVEWFKTNHLNNAPSTTAARTAAQFTLAVLLGEVEL